MGHRLIFFGNERLATGVTTTTPILRGLIEDGYEIATLILAQKPNDKSRKARPPEILSIAEQHAIPVLTPSSLSKAAGEIRNLEADAAVLVAYGKIVPQSVIDLFPRGILNIHPSLLPKHRGSIPIESVILQNETETGVSLMQLAAAMDAGPVYDQRHVALTGSESKQALTDELAKAGLSMLLHHLPAILDGSMQPSPQDDLDVTYDPRITKDDAILDFTKPAAALERQVRAYAGWPRSKIMIGQTDIVITAAHVTTGEGAPGALWIGDGEIGQYTGDGVLVIDSLIPSGKNEMSGKSFLAGYKL